MSKKTFTSALAILFILTLVVPTTFFIAPQKASADSGVVCIGGLVGGLIGNLTSATDVPATSKSGNTINGQTAGATLASCVNTLILVPLARAAIKAMLQKMTASVIGFITGKSTGQPSFVPNLSVHLQLVGDSTALSFISQMATSFNSPFGKAISSSLQLRYNQNTSIAGFWAANQCTLSKSSPNINKFLAGDWSQGGAAAWFALTTQDQNNPYTLYMAAQSQMGSNVGQAQTNRRQDLMQSNGFLSMCAPNTTAATGSSVNPQAPCTNADGTPAQASTPGSVIHDYTQKAVVNLGFDQMNADLISANDIDGALGAIVSTLVTQVFNGVGGLLASSQSSGGRSSVTSQLNNYSDSSTAATQSVSGNAQAMLDRTTSYTAALNTITTAANTASTSIMDLVAYCTAQQADPQTDPRAVSAASTTIPAAQTALDKEVSPVLAQMKSVSRTIATTTAFATKVQSEASGATAGSSATSTLASNMRTLMAMPPSATDLVTIQQAAQTSGGARANPTGSLTVSGGSMVDQMNLISTNAVALKAKCNSQTYMVSSGSSSDSSSFNILNPSNSTPSDVLNPLSSHNPITNPIGSIFGW